MSHALSKISVIVPVYNDPDRLGLLIDSLLKQDYPKELYEIIVVDNGSTDRTPAMIRQRAVQFLEQKMIRSSYAARNLGIQHAKNGILAFIDSDCVADPQWLRAGAEALMEADLAGGKVEFFMSSKKSAAEIYDSMTGMRNELTIKEYGTSTTANLFVKAPLFKKIGLFPEVKSGGDFQWTKTASQLGYKMVFAPKAIVRHPARAFKALLQKSLRTGKGYPQIWDKLNTSWSARVKITIKKFLPPRPSSIKELIAQRTPGLGYEQRWSGIWTVAYFCNIATCIGICSFWLNKASYRK